MEEVLVHKFIIVLYWFLGSSLKKKLSWEPHVKQTKPRALKRINIIKCLANTKRGADQSTLLYIHRTVVLSVPRYGETVYGSAKPKVIDKLEPVNNKGIRLTIGAYCITKTAHIQRELNQNRYRR
jgi:hypothetical protein